MWTGISNNQDRFCWSLMNPRAKRENCECVSVVVHLLWGSDTYFSFIDLDSFEPFKHRSYVVKHSLFKFPRSHMIVFPLDTLVYFQAHTIHFWKWLPDWTWLPSIWNISFWPKQLFLQKVLFSPANCSIELRKKKTRQKPPQDFTGAP